MTRRRRFRRSSRLVTRDYVLAAGELLGMFAKHRGDLGAVQQELENELQWARFRAKHGLVDVDVDDLAAQLAAEEDQPDVDETGS